MSLSLRSGVFGTLLLALSGTACGTTQAANPFEPAPHDEDVFLTVENNDFRDATIYAYWNGVRDRVGMVVGKTSETFRMEWRSEEIQLGIDFVGGGGYRTETLDVWSGDHLNFVILPGG